MRRVILRSLLSPGDALMLTAAVRDLHAAYPQRFQTDVRTGADALWENNPHITPLQEGDKNVETLDVHYPLIHQSNQRPYHFLHGYAQFLEQEWDLKIPITRFCGDVYLSDEERSDFQRFATLGAPPRFWILVAGGKYDFTAKWWNPESFQQVVDYFQGRINFVQCGNKGDYHFKLHNVVDFVGKTTLRDFVCLMHFAEGVVCPVTFAMHLAAAVETRPTMPKHRPCVVIAGGREPPHWEAYPHHQFLSTVGTLTCCEHGGCWKSRCQLVGDGDVNDRRNVCEQPVQVNDNLRISACMNLITAEDVIRRIELYYTARRVGIAHHDSCRVGVAHHAAAQSIISEPNSRLVGDAHPTNHSAEGVSPMLTHENKRMSLSEKHRTVGNARLNSVEGADASPKKKILLRFRHGLGDAVQLTIVLKHLQRFRPQWSVDVAALVGKHSAYHDLCRKVHILEQEPHRSQYDECYDLDWHECRTDYADWPGTKPSRCLLEVFRIDPVADLYRYSIQRGKLADKRAAEYLGSICETGPDEKGRYPVVLIHYQGNTSGQQKDLSHSLIEEVCEIVIRAGNSPVILDWDRRSPLVNGDTIHCPGADHPLWNGRGTGDAEMIAALIEASSLMIGVDSGPSHVAGATSTPTIAVWTHHHPVHYFDLAENVLHLVPQGHKNLAMGPKTLAYFHKHYRHRVYKQLHVDLPALVESHLTGEDVEKLANKRFLGRLRAKSFNAQYYEEHKQEGLDYLNFGDWQKRYGRWLIDSLELKGKRVLDVGCACGSILRGLGQAGAIVAGVDLNEHAVQLGRQKWPDMVGLLHVCDAVNLHLFGDREWDAVHTAQVAEHWPPHLVPFILRELWRVTAPGGLLFCALDTEELFARQGRTLENEDPTHVCIKPMAWWKEQLSQTGWRDCTDEYATRLKNHPESFLKTYDWDWFIAQRTPERRVGAAHVESRTVGAAHRAAQRSVNIAPHAAAQSTRSEPNPLSVGDAHPTLDAPVFVSGVPRSGTTWMQCFLSHHPRIHIHGQFPTLPWSVYWQTLQTLIQAGRTAAQSNQNLGYEIAHYAGSDEIRCRQIFRRLLQDYFTGFGPSKPIWGLKSLQLCIEPGAVEQVESLWPQARWIVCLRDPFRTIESLKNTFGADVPLDTIAASWVNVCRFAAGHDQTRTIVFQLDKLIDFSLRKHETEQILNMLGESHTEETRIFLCDNPVIHKNKPDDQRDFRLSNEDRLQLLDAVEGLYECMEQFDYAIRR